MGIQRIIEIPIEELQNEDAKNNWFNYKSNQCCLCGKKVGENPKMIHYLSNGNIVSYHGEDIVGSQGFSQLLTNALKSL